MLIRSDCIGCVINMALRVAREALKEERKIMDLINRVLRLETLDGIRTHLLTAPEITSGMLSLIAESAGTDDPLSQVKKQHNQAIMDLYPAIRGSVFASPDPFGEAVRYAIIGNSIDMMVDIFSKGADEVISGFSERTLESAQVEVFRSRLAEARRILYFTDNCGEIVLDRILIEAVKQYFNKTVTVIVKKCPSGNDATIEDALFVGLDAVAELRENGIDMPFGGTMLKHVSSRILSLVQNADLLIAKGGGNYDTLTEEASLVGKTTYLFQAKCRPYSMVHHVPVGSLLIHNN